MINQLVDKDLKDAFFGPESLLHAKNLCFITFIT